MARFSGHLHLDQLSNDAARADGELDWGTYTSMSVHCRLVILKYLKERLQTIANTDRSHIERLLNLTAALARVLPRNVRFINQIATAQRFHILLGALLGRFDNNDESDHILSLYGDTASVAGFISGHRDIAIRDFFLVKYHRIDQFTSALYHLTISEDLARIVADKPSIKRAMRIQHRFQSWRPRGSPTILTRHN